MRTSRRAGRLRLVARALAISLLLANASACDSATVTAVSGSPSPTPAVFELDRAVAFTSLDELARHSSVVAIVAATSEVEVIQTPLGLIYTMRTVEVVRSLRGADEGTRLVVRQHARDIDILNDLPPHLVAGEAYLLFLDRFHLSGGGVADDYMVTGLAGQFAQTAPDVFVRQDPLSPQLPEYISEADVREAVHRAPYDPGPPEAGTTGSRATRATPA